MQYTQARLIAHSKEVRDDGSIIEIVIWELPRPVEASRHRFKYRLFFGRPGQAWVRYDNERGKGDHRHRGAEESAYAFVDLARLLDDFERDIEEWSAS